MREDGGGWMMAFIGGFLLGAMLTGGVFGTYLLIGAGRYSAEAQREAMRVEDAMRAAAAARDEAEQQRRLAEQSRREAEERIRELEARQKP